MTRAFAREYFTQVGAGAGGKLHLLGRVHAHVPAKKGAIAAHGAKDDTHVERVEPMQHERWKVQPLENRDICI